jgi:predicted ester cyclase
MSLDKNKALVREFIEEVMNKGNTEAIPDYCVTGSMFAGGIAGQVNTMKTAFPDNHFSIETILAEGNQVAVQVMTNGTNTGPLVGLPAFGKLEQSVPPTGQTVVSSGMYIFTLVKGKIASYKAELDQIAILRQLGWSFIPPGTT